MTPDVVEAYAALRRDHPARPLPRDLEEWMILEIVRLRDEVQAERGDTVAALRRTSNHGPMGLSLVNLDSIAEAIERGEHRREEEK